MQLSEEKILQLLENALISYTVRRHPPIYTVDEGRALMLPDLDAAAKTLFVTDAKHQNFYIVTLPLDKRLDLKILRAALQSRRLTMASSDELLQLIGLAPGAVTPFGMLNDEDKKIQFIIDAACAGKIIAVPLLSNTQTIWLSADKLLEFLRAQGYRADYLEL